VLCVVCVCVVCVFVVVYTYDIHAPDIDLSEYKVVVHDIIKLNNLHISYMQKKTYM
jgi:hypothetical protein